MDFGKIAKNFKLITKKKKFVLNEILHFSENFESIKKTDHILEMFLETPCSSRICYCLLYHVIIATTSLTMFAWKKNNSWEKF